MTVNLPDKINEGDLQGLTHFEKLVVDGDIINVINEWKIVGAYCLRGHGYSGFEKIQPSESQGKMPRETKFANLWKAPDGVIWTVTELLTDVLGGNFHEWLYLQNLNNKEEKNYKRFNPRHNFWFDINSNGEHKWKHKKKHTTAYAREIEAWKLKGGGFKHGSVL